MRMYQNPVEMIKEVERDLVEMGTIYQSATCQDKDVSKDPRWATMEIFGYTYQLLSWTDKQLIEMMQYNKNNIPWAMAEMQERFDPTGPNPGRAWMQNENFWKQFIRNGCFSYAYGERWQEQIPYVCRELKQFPNTRQAIITMYDRHQDMMNWGGMDRVPCSVSYQFLLREGKLHVVYNERSCDFVKFFATDVYLTIKLLEFIAYDIGVKVGTFMHFLGSLHLFKGDVEDRTVF